MGLRQRYWRAKVTDLYLDEAIQRLIKRCNCNSEAELLTQLILEADKRTA